MPTKIRTFDFSIVIFTTIFLAVGVSVIYSLVFGGINDGLGLKQAIIGLIGMALMFFTSFVDYRFFRGTAWIFYLVAIALLILVNFLGKTANGAENWIDLKFFQLQPSEIAKIFLIFALAAFFSNKIEKLKWRDIFVSFFLLLIPLGLVLIEPDFGTAMVIVFIYFIMLLLSKPSKLQIGAILSAIIIGISVITLAYMNIKPFGDMLQDYQRQRIAVFLNPSSDLYGRGYNVNQAQITIGSGGIMGKNLGKGTQSQLQFLPEAHTDFIFAGIAESFGFLGSIILLFLYCLFILRLLSIAQSSLDNFGMLVAIGICAMFTFQVVENVGMNLGLLPVTGIPLPFLSYGGTSLLVSFFSVGIIESVFIRHKKLSF
jgi:rod shape determining protein RodA